MNTREVNTLLLFKVSRAIGLADSIASPIFPLQSSKPGAIERIAAEVRDTLIEVRKEMMGEEE
jgi:hypothetical protein